MRPNQLKAILFAVLLFVSGALVGALGDRYYTAEEVSAKTSSETFRQRYVSEMKSKLNLSADQVRQLDAILDDTKAKYRTVRDSYRPAMVKIKEDQIRRVKSILTDRQIAAYDQLVSERERRWKEQEDRDQQPRHAH
jgi:DNA primase